RFKLSAFPEVEQVSSDHRTVLYRIAHEALANVGRHAQASLVEVEIRKVDGAVCMTVKDNGKGFQQDGSLRARKDKRLGLLGMRERLEMLGGQFDIASTPGEGTTVSAQIPLKPRRSSKKRTGRAV
ncbi:MAG TPA: ATP-binding protein, partial [Verrucomicrobiae bacterium]|nr:ATP-binding protein [Verrucomicrobiae bacterium]